MTSMHRLSVAAAALAVCVAGCERSPTAATSGTDLAAAFESVLLGFDNTTNTFEGGPDGGDQAWAPDDDRHGDGDRHEGPGGHHHGDMMGGGLRDPFLGLGFGEHFRVGRFGGFLASDDCAFVEASGRVVCAPATRHGLTIERSAAFLDTNGTPQAAFDDLTNTVNIQVSVTGSVERHGGATSTVDHASDRTVAGLAAGSTQRTVNGTSAGMETTTGTSDQGEFTVVRVMGDTIDSVMIPVEPQDGWHAYPVSGTVIRAMSVTLTKNGDTVTSARREVITYDGSDTATIVITRDGESRTCTLPLPRGRPVCE